MKSKVKSSIIILIALGILFALLPIITINLNFIMRIDEKSSDYNDDNNLDNKNLEISALSGKIHIDDNDPSSNWSVAKYAGICTGNGTYSNPYIIEDLEIDGGSSGSCILIENSDVYFRIENCTVYNSGRGFSSNDAGIRLYNTGNGTLIDNECSSNFVGINLNLCNNYSIVGNTASNNDASGVNLDNAGNGTLIDNECSFNYNGMYLYFCDNITILGNTANLNDQYGILLGRSEYSTISGNTANNNREIGISIGYSYYSTILGNTANNNGDLGILIQYCDYSTVSGNIMNEHGLRLEGMLYSLASINVDNTNQVNGKPLYYYSNAVNLVPANFTNAGQVILVNCDDSLISNLNISYTSYAISLLYGYNNSISESTVSDNDRGIYIYFSDNNTITANTLTNNGEAGIYLSSSNFNDILGNNASNNERFGISLFNCDYNNISGNIANNNLQYGIYLNSNERNTITENNVNYNTDSGIFLYSSNYNNISQNTANYNSGCGIQLFCSDKNILSSNTIMGNDYGIYLHASDFWCDECDSNRIYDNTFSGNGEDIYSTTDYIDNTSPDKPLPNEPSFNLIISIISLFIGGSLIIGLIVSKSRVKH